MRKEDGKEGGRKESTEKRKIEVKVKADVCAKTKTFFYLFLYVKWDIAKAEAGVKAGVGAEVHHAKVEKECQPQKRRRL
jgi:hypothetical protein